MSPAALFRPLGALWVLVALIALVAALCAAAVREAHLAPFFVTTAHVTDAEDCWPGQYAVCKP